MLVSESPTSDSAAITMNHPTLLQLLMIRALCDVDPAPEFASVPEVPDGVRRRIGSPGADVRDEWRSHWRATVSELGPIDPPASGSWSLWPGEFPKPNDSDLAEWNVAVQRPPRGTPLDEHPSHRYYVARSASKGSLPRRLIVLPFEGHFSLRQNAGIGYVSTAQFLDPVDDNYGFAAK